MTSEEKELLYYKMTNIPSLADTEDSYFSDKHMMTNKELCGQVYGYVSEIHKAFNPDVSATLKVIPLQKNGAKFILKCKTKSKTKKSSVGYTGSVYAIARKNNIIAKIIDIFQHGEQALT